MLGLVNESLKVYKLFRSNHYKSKITRFTKKKFLEFGGFK